MLETVKALCRLMHVNAENKSCSYFYRRRICMLIQFEKASEISQIDIGNEASAFVEVLVTKSSAKEDDYQVY